MFNTTNHKTESKVVAVTKEIEKTISPDKVTEMYDSVKEQVKKDLLKAFTFETNQLKGTVMIFTDDLATAVTRYKAGYNLNGDMYEIDGVLQKGDLNNGAEHIINNVYRHYADTIANLLIKETTEQHQLLIK